MTPPRRYPLIAGEMATCFDRDPKGERVRLIAPAGSICLTPIWQIQREDGTRDAVAAGYLQGSPGGLT